ncbi:MAG TPA: tyrosine-protein phosphatase [Gemmataceae bacterium]|nr:tyrosine-protein phosphatase [Gemmataceae bacterium]
MRAVRVLLGLLIAAAIPGVPVGYACHRQTAWRHFHVVEDARLYRSGQLSPSALDRAVYEYGIRTVVSLRCLARPGDVRLENDEEAWCADHGVRYLRLNPAGWESPRGQANLELFLRTVDDPARRPVLVHCFAGLHRTGVYCAVFRMERDGWTNDEAIAEMYSAGRFHEDPAALDFLRQYTPHR